MNGPGGLGHRRYRHPKDRNGGSTMRNASGIAVAIALVLGVAWRGGVGRAQQEGVGEKAGEKLDAVGSKIKRGLNKAKDAAVKRFPKTGASVNSMVAPARAS